MVHVCFQELLYILCILYMYYQYKTPLCWIVKKSQGSYYAHTTIKGDVQVNLASVSLSKVQFDSCVFRLRKPKQRKISFGTWDLD